MRKLSKKGKVYAVAASIALVAASGGAAFAYWTTTGTGSGTATNSGGNGTVKLYATFANGLTPGAIEGVDYTADNNTTSSTVIGVLTPTVTIDGAHSGCDASWFVASPVTSGKLVLASAVGTAVGSGTLKFNDSSTVNQEACKGATVTISVTSN